MLNELSKQTQVKTMPGIKWFGWVPLLFLLDQGSKWLILKYFSYAEFYPVMPGLNLTLAYNRGIAFSLLTTHQALGQIALIGFIMAVIVAIAIWLARTDAKDTWNGISLTLILGGALGNLCDRLWHGYVIDFIDFYVNSWHWYTFNLADTFITIGALMSIKTILRSE
jgi:signal peptidase II